MKISIALCLFVSVLTLGCSFFPPTDMEELSKNVRVGESFSLSLKGNPTTGYSWFMVSTLEKLQLIKTQFKTEEKDKNIVGAGGTFIFDFKALNEGKENIQFQYKRPWEKNPSALIPTQTFTIRILSK